MAERFNFQQYYSRFVFVFLCDQRAPWGTPAAMVAHASIPTPVVDMSADVSLDSSEGIVMVRIFSSD